MALLLILTLLSTSTSGQYLKSSEPVGLPFQTVSLHKKIHRIYWTIDDHPCRQTKKVLSILRTYNIKATFFVVTNSIYWYYKDPHYRNNRLDFSRLQAIVKEGHIIGNHSDTHGLLCSFSFHRIWKKEVLRAQTLIKRAIGLETKWWRSPHGQDCAKLRRATKRLHLRWVWWHISDWKHSANSMFQSLITRVDKGYTYTIILVHNNVRRLRTLLERIKNAYSQHSS